MANKRKISNEEDYVDVLGSLSAEDQSVINYDLLVAEDKKVIDELNENIFSFMKENSDFNSYDEAKKDELFDKLTGMHNEFKDKVRNCRASVEFNNLELNTIEKKIKHEVEYTTETGFYGVHIKRNFIDTLPKATSGEFVNHNIVISLTHSTILHHLLTSVKMKGLNKTTYAFCNVLYKLAEVIKVYNYYDGLSNRQITAIKEWNLGLSSSDITKLKGLATEEVATEMIKS